MPSKQAKIAAVSKDLQRIAGVIDAELAKSGASDVAFSLFVFTDGRAQYISNSTDRVEIKRALLSILDGWDTGMPDVPAHKVQ